MLSVRRVRLAMVWVVWMRMECGGVVRPEAHQAERLVDPRKLSGAEVRQPEVANLHDRTRCWACIQGPARKNKHQRGRKDEKGLQEIHFDIVFLRDRVDPGGPRACMVAREVDARMTLATMFPSKSGDRFVADRAMAFVPEVGGLYGDVVRSTIRPRGCHRSSSATTS